MSFWTEIQQKFVKRPDRQAPPETTVLSPQDAARKVFERLNEIKGGPQFIANIATLYDSSNYEPVYTGNSLLSYGRLSRWVESDDENTHNDLRRGLKIIFKVELEKGEKGEKEIAFVDALGKLVTGS